jgi:hypothetical protein
MIKDEKIAPWEETEHGEQGLINCLIYISISNDSTSISGLFIVYPGNYHFKKKKFPRALPHRFRY